MAGFVSDFVGAAGCDGGGNAMAAGVNKMFGEGRTGAMGALPHDELHHDANIDHDLAGEEQMFPQNSSSSWHENYFAHQGMPAQMQPPPDMASEFLAQEQHARMMHAESLQQQQQQHQVMQQPAQQTAGGDWAEELMAQQKMNVTEGETDWAAQFQAEHEDSWANEYTTEGVQTFGVEGEAPVDFETKSSDCKFFKFLDQVKNGEIELDDKQPTTAAPTQDWADEFRDRGEAAMTGMGVLPNVAPLAAHSDWANDYTMQQQPEPTHMEGATNGDWATQFQNEVDSLRDPQGIDVEYVFEEDNPYMYHDGPFAEGVELLEAGMLSEAVLAFEAVCQKEPENHVAWQRLGITQQENEKDLQAIAALKQCRKLDPTNHEVLMALSVSLTNETKFSEAIDTLTEWLVTHPSYKDHAAELHAAQGDSVEMSQEYFFLQSQAHGKVAAMFERAQQIQPLPDVWIGLGVLYNMSGDYRRAVLNLEKALEVQKNDPKLWNKLGASLANGNRCSDALKAYNRALDLNPGFVRALYNCAISYSNLGEHHLAAQFFLRAIHMQNGGKGGASGTREMWDSLRVTFSLLGRQDLVAKSMDLNVSAFGDEFNLEAAW